MVGVVSVLGKGCPLLVPFLGLSIDFSSIGNIVSKSSPQFAFQANGQHATYCTLQDVILW